MRVSFLCVCSMLAGLVLWTGCDHAGGDSSGTSGDKDGGTDGDKGGDKGASCPVEPPFDVECGGGNAYCTTETGNECGDVLHSGLPMCQSDASCADAGADAYCHSGCGVCKKACTSDQDCISGETCATGRCVPRPCAEDADCPTNFACRADAGMKTCARKSCQTDADCSGYCVLHECQAELGYCIGW